MRSRSSTSSSNSGARSSASSSAVSQTSGSGFLTRLAVFAFVVLACQLLAFRMLGSEGHTLITTPYRILPHAPVRLTLGDVDSILESKPHILYLGDSTLFPVPSDEADFRDTSQMLEPLVPGCEVAGFRFGAFNMEIFHLVLRHLAARGSRPELIIAPINLRSFSETWYLKPAWRFDHLRLHLQHESFLERAFLKPLETLKLLRFEAAPQLEYTRAVINAFDRSMWKRMRPSKDRENPGFAQMLKVAQHDFVLDNSHPLLEAMREIRQQADAIDASLILYITPTSIRSIRSTLGRGSARRASLNLETIRSFAKQAGIEILDLSNTLEVPQIEPLGATVSHLAAPGRMALAAMLAEHARDSGELACLIGGEIRTKGRASSERLQGGGG